MQMQPQIVWVECFTPYMEHMSNSGTDKVANNSPAAIHEPEQSTVSRTRSTVATSRFVEEVRTSGMLPTPRLAAPIYGSEGVGFS